MSEKILARLKGLQAQMHEEEEPLFSIPTIWENATEKQTQACDLVLTNQRLFGYIYTTFPRERLFLDALELADVKAVVIKQKSFEAVFRELFVSDGKKKIYLRAPRKKIEDTYAALRSTLEEYFPQSSAVQKMQEPGEQTPERSPARPIYGRQVVKQSLERSPLGITILFVGGLLLEIVGVLIWAATSSLQTGLPLCSAGIIAVVVAIFARRQLR
jgi:hypothetical protein